MPAVVDNIPGFTSSTPPKDSLWSPEQAVRETYMTRDGMRPAWRTQAEIEATAADRVQSDGLPVIPGHLRKMHESLVHAAKSEELSAADLDRLGHRAQNVDFGQIPASGQDFAFDGSEAERAHWLEILPDIECNPWKVDRFRECGKDAWLHYDLDKQKYAIRSNRCKLRICPHCRLALQKKHARRIRDSVGVIERHTWQFITLTMRHTTADLTKQLSQLRKSFRKLRQRKCWKTHVTRGYAVIEIGWNGDKQEWHPHMHVVAETSFIPWSKLRSDWSKCTFGSDQIDCRWVDEADEAIQYACKYLGKPPDPSCMNTIARATEYYEGLTSARLFIPFGPHPPQPTKEERKADKPNVVAVMPMCHLIKACNLGYLPALRIMRDLIQHRDEDLDFQRRLQRTTFLRPGKGNQIDPEDTS